MRCSLVLLKSRIQVQYTAELSPSHDHRGSVSFHHHHFMDSFKSRWRSFKRHSNSHEDIAPPPYVGPGIDYPCEKTARRSRESQRSHSLTGLPRDIFTGITNHLDPVSVQCLRITAKMFYSSFKVDEDSLSRCGKWLVMARIEQDAIDEYLARPMTASSLPPERISTSKASSSLTFVKTFWKRTSHKVELQEDVESQDHPSDPPQCLQRLTCSLCKVKHPHSAFMSNTNLTFCFRGVALDIGHLSSPDMDHLFSIKSVERLCAHHMKGKIGLKWKKDDDYQGDRWLAYRKDFCLHCGLHRNDPYYQIRCRCSPASSHEVTCSVCPCIKLRCFEREHATDSKHLERLVFVRNYQGRLTVQETLKGKSSSP